MIYTTTKVMLEGFLSYLSDEKLFNRQDSLLVAVSGGVDSMVLLDILWHSGFQVMAAHVNHGLRGAESDADQYLVVDYCSSRSIPFEVMAVMPDTWQKSGNFQEMARDLRYEWLQSLCQKHGYRYILTAHHRDDAVETFLMNLTRGAGLHGLKGIHATMANIVRPMLHLSRQEIRHYAAEHKVPYREDSSNLSPKYVRNRIRNEVLPLLQDVDPRIRTGITHTMANLTADSELLDWLVSQWADSHIITDVERMTLALHELPPGEIGVNLIFHVLRPFGFNYAQAREICHSTKVAGAVFMSQSHRALADRGKLDIVPVKTDGGGSGSIPIHPPIVLSLGRARFEVEYREIQGMPDFEKNTLYLAVNDPADTFEARLWQPGDRICPYGMGGKSKKVQDVLTDRKMSLFEKQQTYVILSGGKLVAIPGICIDESRKINQNTDKIIVIRQLPNH